MKRTQIDFNLQEAGCLLYIADRHLGGFPFGELHEFFGGRKGLKDLTLQGAIMAMSLYQDDGYCVRFIVGELTDQEKSEWTSKVSWKLNLESSEMVVSGVCDEDFEEYLADFESATNDGEYEFGCFVNVPAGIYQADVYSYPPNDLASGWLEIEEKRRFRDRYGKDAIYEKPIDYFARTRPNEIPPEWVKEGYQENSFLDFVVHLTPMVEDPKLPEFENDGCIQWEFRKPEICPIGIRLDET